MVNFIAMTTTVRMWSLGVCTGNTNTLRTQVISADHRLVKQRNADTLQPQDVTLHSKIALHTV